MRCKFLNQILFSNAHELHYKRIRASIRKLFSDLVQLHLFQNKFVNDQLKVKYTYNC